LSGYAERNYEAFREAEHHARRAGNVWLQISALVWMLAIEPQASTARRLHQLLDITAWRQPVLAPPEVAADAALAMTVTGERGRSILELALTAGRPAVTTEVVMRHLDDPNVTSAARTAAVDVLGSSARCSPETSSRDSRSATMTWAAPRRSCPRAQDHRSPSANARSRCCRSPRMA